jgi:hypothetical protein
MSVPVEAFRPAPQRFDDIEPFLRVSVTGLVVVRQRKTECFVFRFIPAGDDVEADPAAADLIDRGELLCDDDRMIGGGMDGGKYRDVPGVCANRPVAQVMVSSTPPWKLVSPP